MKWQTTLILVLSTLTFGVLGGVVFFYIEGAANDVDAAQAVVNINTFLANHSCMTMADLYNVTILQYEIQTGGIYVTKNYSYWNVTNWDIPSAISLSLHLVGSIGFGPANPVTMGGRIFAVIYTLIGLPMLIAAAIAFGDILTKITDRVLFRIYHRHDVIPSFVADLRRAVAMTVLGIVLFIVIAAAIFTTLETWSYWECLYYCFCTALTVGFGDFIPSSQRYEYYQWYRIGIAVWTAVCLMWFGGVWISIREAVEIDADINRPLTVDLGEPNKKIANLNAERRNQVIVRNNAVIVGHRNNEIMSTDDATRVVIT